MAGAALNRSRMTTSCSSSGVDSDVTAHSAPVNINLFNMEDPKFADSKYVLTSPRSLEACSRLGLKPVELLHKPLIEFEEELLPKGVLLRTVYAVYDDHEADRQRKLRASQEERECIIQEDMRGKYAYTSPLIKTAVRTPEKPVSSAKKSTTKETVHLDGGDDLGSIQRRRTAWTTSIGHDRITKDELNKRAKELYEEGRHVEKKDPVKKMVPKSKTQKVRYRKQSQRNQPRSQSLSDLQPKMWSRTSNLVVDAKPVTDPKLRSKLQRSRTLHAKINPKDEKILQIMMKKREEERAKSTEREAAKLTWEEQRKEVQSVRAGTHRRKSFNDRHNSDNTRQHLRMNGINVHIEENSHVPPPQTTYEMSHKRWAEHFQKQMQIREQQFREKKLQELQRKKSQELSLKAQGDEMSEFQKLVHQKLQHDLKKASSKRESKEYEERIQRKLKSYQAKLQHEERLKEIQQKNEEEIDNLASSLEVKHSAAEDKYKQLQAQREKDLRLHQILRDEKIRKSQKLREQMEAELQDWHQDLLNYRKVMEERAAEAASQTQARKSKKAHEERVFKEKSHRVNLEKVLEDEESRKNEMEQILSLKDSRSQMIQQQKEAHIQQSRSIALASQRLRDELRQQYSDSTFDKMAKQAELEAKIGAGINTATKNLSKVVLT